MADLKFSKSTDTEHEIKLDSELISASWKATAARTGSQTKLEVRTAFVGNGAKIKITVKTDGGKKVAKLSDAILSNVFVRSVDIPEDLSLNDAVYFEYELPDNSISGKSKSIPVIPTPTIKKIEWSAKEARRGDKLTLTAELEDVKDNSPAQIIIYEYDSDGNREKITEIKVEVKKGKVETIWEYEYHEDTADLMTEEEMKEYGKKYNPPEYFFSIKLEDVELGLEQESKLLLFKDWVDIELVNQKGDPIPEEEYILILPDGQKREGKLDKAGKATEKDVPPGKFEVKFKNL